MSTQIRSIAPFQAGKVAAIMYFIFGLIFAIPFALMFGLAASQQGAAGAGAMGIGMVIMMPIGYAIAGLIFVPLACWLYNVVAGWVGGIEIQLQDGGGA